MKYAISYQKSDNVIIGTWRGESALIPSPPGDAVYEMVEVSQTQFERYDGPFHEQSSHPKWKWETNDVIEIPDPRPTVRFTPLLVELEVGDPAETITCALLKSDGTVQTNFNGSRIITVSFAHGDRGTRRVKFSFTAGVATVQVPTGRSFSLILDKGDEWIAEAPLVIHVYGTTLGD